MIGLLVVLLGSFSSFSPSGIALVPDQYYLDLPCMQEDLRGLQSGLGEIPGAYQEGVWDCSNMASYLQWRLKSLGFDTKICASDHFKGKKQTGPHAWVAVDLRGMRYYINPVDYPMRIIGPENERYGNFDSPEEIYSSIYEINPPQYLADYTWWKPELGQLDFIEEEKNLLISVALRGVI